MRVPNELLLRVTCPTSADLKDLIVQLRVKAGTKNPYVIYFPKTSGNGTAVLTATEFSGQFTDHWQAGLMDYNGSLEEAEPRVEVSLYDAAWIRSHQYESLAWPLLPHEKTKFESRRAAYDYMRWNRNDGFAADGVTVNLDENQVVTFPVTPR